MAHAASATHGRRSQRRSRRSVRGADPVRKSWLPAARGAAPRCSRSRALRRSAGRHRGPLAGWRVGSRHTARADAAAGASAEEAEEEEVATGAGTAGAAGAGTGANTATGACPAGAVRRGARPLWWGDSPELDKGRRCSGELARGARAALRRRGRGGADRSSTRDRGGDRRRGGVVRALRARARRAADAALARNNLIRGLLKRATPASLRRRSRTRASAELQPDAAEMRHQLGVVRMHCNDLDAAADAYGERSRSTPSSARHHGAHVLAQLAADGDTRQRARLLRVARLGVAAGLWRTSSSGAAPAARVCPGRPWHDKRARVRRPPRGGGAADAPSSALRGGAARRRRALLRRRRPAATTRRRRRRRVAQYLLPAAGCVTTRTARAAR